MGDGSTVTTIENGVPGHELVKVAGVTIYSTVSDDAFEGFVSTWLMFEPVPALAPAIPPVFVPILQLNEVAEEAVNVIFVLAPLQIDIAGVFVINGEGFTVTVIGKTAPTQELALEVGVTKYSTVPAEAEPGLASVWLIVVPEPALAPVIPPFMFPVVQVKALGVEALKLIFAPDPLHIFATAELVMTGEGFTVTLIG